MVGKKQIYVEIYDYGWIRCEVGKKEGSRMLWPEYL